MEEVSQQYKEGFNNGYLLAKHEPELAVMLTKHPNDHSEYFKGLNSGTKEYEMEKLKEKSKLHEKDISKEKDTERERD